MVIDECATTTAMTRTHGRAPPGERVHDSLPSVNWQIKTLAGAIRLGQGVTAALTYNGPTDTQAFLSFTQECLVPTLHAGDVVVMDNLRPHKVAAVREAIEACGAKVMYLPPYSPDLSPIEPVWAKVKERLRSAKARTDQGLIDAIGDALRAVTPGDVEGCFRHCGYS